MISLSHETQILSTLWSKSVNEIYIARCIMGRQGIKLDKAHAFSSRFLQLCAQEEKALSQWGAIFHTTRQTISNWQTGESVPDIIKLADIAQYFGVSTDYLLGLSDTKSPDAGAKAAVEYTGLSEEAVERLHIGLDHFICDGEAMCEKARAKNLHTASKLIASREFSELVSRLAYAQEAALSQQLLQLIYEQHTESANNSDDLDEDCAFVFANPEDRVLTESTIQYLVLRKWNDDELCQKLHEMDDEELLDCVIDGIVTNRNDCELYQFHASKELNRYIDRLIEETKEHATRDFPDVVLSHE